MDIIDEGIILPDIELCGLFQCRTPFQLPCICIISTHFTTRPPLVEANVNTELINSIRLVIG